MNNLYMHIFAGVKQASLILKIILIWGSGVLNSYPYSAMYMSHSIFKAESSFVKLGRQIRYFQVILYPYKSFKIKWHMVG